MLPQEKVKYTLEEYLELDHNSEEKIEFWDGHIFTLVGANINHNRIQRNCTTYLQNKLQGSRCEVFPSDTRVKVPAYPPYRYPDLSALCGKPIIENLGKQDLLTNPQLIVEVLPIKPDGFERGYKFTYYKSIESFTVYILIAQDRPHVSQFVKQAENSWVNHEFNSLEEKFYIESLECELTLKEIYENVEFPPIQDRLRIIE